MHSMYEILYTARHGRTLVGIIHRQTASSSLDRLNRQSSYVPVPRRSPGRNEVCLTRPCPLIRFPLQSSLLWQNVLARPCMKLCFSLGVRSNISPDRDRATSYDPGQPRGLHQTLLHAQGLVPLKLFRISDLQALSERLRQGESWKALGRLH